MRRDFDHIVVGAGSAGAVVAARLAEDPSRRVLLLEAGGWDWSPYIHIPGFLANVVFSRSLNWAYLGEPDPSLDDRRLTWMAGRVLGGSSSINGMVYGRGLRSDYADWSLPGGRDWSWEALLPWFRLAETWTGAPHPARGDAGPLQVRPFADVHPVCRAVMEAYIAAGVPAVDDYSIGIEQGIGETQATQRHGWRSSTARAYLRTARPNLCVATGAQALALTIEHRRCVGVTYARRGRVHRAGAAREVVLAAGAIGTPQLLLLSGVGSGDDLRELGIDVTHDLPGVGRGLNDHVNIKLSARVGVATYNSERFGARKYANGLRFLARRDGPAASPANHVQGFVAAGPGGQAEHQVQVMALGFNADPADRADGVSIVISPCHPAARGIVSLRSKDARRPPRIRFHALAEPGDREILLRGGRLAREMLRAGPGAMFGGEVFLPSPQTDADADWLAFFRATAGLNWHPTSTCRMGADPAAVVDDDLCVRGLEGLSIADASVFPHVTSGNTNAPVIAIAERAAALISDRTS